MWRKKTLSCLTLFDLRKRGSSSLEGRKKTRSPFVERRRSARSGGGGAFSPTCWNKELIWVKVIHGYNRTNLRCRDKGLCSYNAMSGAPYVHLSSLTERLCSNYSSCVFQNVHILSGWWIEFGYCLKGCIGMANFFFKAFYIQIYFFKPFTFYFHITGYE